MCLAIPGKIIKIQDEIANIQYGEGVTNKANVSMVDVKVGDYVLVHAGFAIKVMSEEDAKKTLAVWEEMLALGEAP
jgi:hydrogenase expression/formation protein HypC